MAVKAFASVLEHTTDTNNNMKVCAIIQISVLGSDLGDLQESTYHITECDLPTTAISTFNEKVVDAIKTSMQGHGITFGILDTITLR